MMLTSPRRRCPRVARLEPLEGRQLLASAVAPPAGGPTVAFAQFEPLTGRVLVVYSGDLAGYDDASLTDPANYSLSLNNLFSKLPSKDESRPSAGVVLAPTFEVTGVTLSTPVAPGQPQSLIVSINNNQPLREGVYKFTIDGVGIVDLAGRELDGAYQGAFPSGDGRPGSDFQARLTADHNTVAPPLPVTPPTTPPAPDFVVATYDYVPPPTPTKVRIAPATPGHFMLAGGNHVTLSALPGQNFPGTFRLRKNPPLQPFEGNARKS